MCTDIDGGFETTVISFFRTSFVVHMVLICISVSKPNCKCVRVMINFVNNKFFSVDKIATCCTLGCEMDRKNELCWALCFFAHCFAKSVIV